MAYICLNVVERREIVKLKLDRSRPIGFSPSWTVNCGGKGGVFHGGKARRNSNSGKIMHCLSYTLEIKPYAKLLRKYASRHWKIENASQLELSNKKRRMQAIINKK